MTPLTPDQRTAIADDIRAGLPRNEIARKHERSPSTVTGIAKDEGLAFDRSATKSATQARVADVEARLSKLADDLLEDAERLRRQLWEPCEIHSFGGRDNMHNSVELDEPTFADKRHIVGSVRMLASTVADLRSRTGDAKGESFIERLFNTLALGATEEAA